MSLAKILDALSWRVYLIRQLEYALWCEHWEAESGAGSVPTGSVGPGRPQLHWGSVCPDDGKSFRSTFLGKRNLSTKSLRIVVQQAFQGTHREVPIMWTGTTWRITWTAPKAMKLSGGGVSQRSKLLAQREKKMFTQEQSTPPDPERAERSQWEEHSGKAGSYGCGHPAGAFIFCYPLRCRERASHWQPSHHTSY